MAGRGRRSRRTGAGRPTGSWRRSTTAAIWSSTRCGRSTPNVPLTQVRASRGKTARAEPVAALYEQGKIHHVGVFEDLETQMCEGTTKSPDRVDALVWAITRADAARGGARW